jgi:hypothetical protein
MPAPQPQRANSEVEQAWIDAWNDLADLAGALWDAACLLPDFRCVSVNERQLWLQKYAYEGYSLALNEVWHEGRRGIAVNRTKPHPLN